MKKVFLSLAFLLGIFSTPVFADDQGILLDCGVAGFIKFYTYEQISYVYNWDNKFSLGTDFRVMNNLKRFSERDPYCYFQTGLFTSYDTFYVSVGPVFYDKMKDLSGIGFYGRMGYRNNLIKTGVGKLGLDLGAELSSTFYKVQEEGETTTIGDAFAEIANLGKLTAGLTWYLPF